MRVGAARSQAMSHMRFSSRGLTTLAYRVSQKSGTMQIFMKIHMNVAFIDYNHSRYSNCSPAALTFEGAPALGDRTGKNFPLY